VTDAVAAAEARGQAANEGLIFRDHRISIPVVVVGQEGASK
jgi:hypothetical protein